MEIMKDFLDKNEPQSLEYQGRCGRYFVLKNVMPFSREASVEVDEETGEEYELEAFTGYKYDMHIYRKPEWERLQTARTIVDLQMQLLEGSN